VILLRAACALVLLCILVAGLRPFHAPRNEVRWLNSNSGILFGKYGSVVSAGSFKSDPRRSDSSWSLEIWLEPKRVHASGTILAFYQPERQVAAFALRQSLGDLELLRAGQKKLGQSGKTYVDDIFSHQKPVLVAITSGPYGTTVFVDGEPSRKFENLKVSSRDLTGRLIIGNSPVTTDEWSGQLKGLAIYDRELTADEVSQHVARWKNSAQPDVAKSGSAIARYLFNEGAGTIVHNQMDSATDLLIPERFFVLHAQFLERPWDEFRPDRNYWKDVGINVAGFLPLGFFFCAYFSHLPKVQHPAALTIALGFAVSFTVEILQAFLPTRDSGMTDLITNTLGAALGAMVAAISVPYSRARETQRTHSLA
jgi:VanZ family protein